MAKPNCNRTVEAVPSVLQTIRVDRIRLLFTDLNRRYRGIFNEAAENAKDRFFLGEDAVLELPTNRLDFLNPNEQSTSIISSIMRSPRFKLIHFGLEPPAVGDTEGEVHVAKTHRGSIAQRDCDNLPPFDFGPR